MFFHYLNSLVFSLIFATGLVGTPPSPYSLDYDPFENKIGQSFTSISMYDGAISLDLSHNGNITRSNPVVTNEVITRKKSMLRGILPCIGTLILRNNRISKLTTLTELKKSGVEFLDLANNNIEDPAELINLLSSWTALKSIDLSGNPIVNNDECLEEIINFANEKKIHIITNSDETQFPGSPWKVS